LACRLYRLLLLAPAGLPLCVLYVCICRACVSVVVVCIGCQANLAGLRRENSSSHEQMTSCSSPSLRPLRRPRCPSHTSPPTPPTHRQAAAQAPPSPGGAAPLFLPPFVLSVTLLAPPNIIARLTLHAERGPAAKKRTTSMFGRRKKDGGGGGKKDKGRNSEDELLKVSCEGGQAGRGRRGWRMRG